MYVIWQRSKFHGATNLMVLVKLKSLSCTAFPMQARTTKNSKTISANPLNVDELNDARKEIIRIVQRNSFVDEVTLLHQKNVETSSAEDKEEESHRIPKSSNLCID